jgi:signal transduction histidine kinase
MTLTTQLQHIQRLQLAGTLASGIAHDLNNQLTLVLGHLQVAVDRLPATEEDTLDSLRLAQIAAGHCANLSQRLLNLGRHVPAPKSRKPLDLSAAILETQQLLGCIKPRNVNMRVQVDPGLLLPADPIQIQQVLMNLATNAFHAMPAGGEFRIKAWADDNICIAVRDNGCGIPESLRRRVFEPFFTTHPEDGGTGLGLASVSAIVRNLGGSLELDSESGKGTTFLLTFPLPVEKPGDLPLAA